MRSRLIIPVLVSVLILGTLGFSQDVYGPVAILPDIDISEQEISTCQTLNIPGQTYFLTADIATSGNCIIITADDITLDCDSFNVIGSGSGTGILLNERTGVTVKNCTVTGFNTGIYLLSSSGNILTGNTANSNNFSGIFLSNSSGNILTGNTASNNRDGIFLLSSSDNTLTDNTTNSNNFSGIFLLSSSGNILTGNTANSNNFFGIALSRFSGSSSNSNTINDNTVEGNKDGFGVGGGADANQITGNLIAKNEHGIHICVSLVPDNTIFPNKFEGPQQAVHILRTC